MGYTKETVAREVDTITSVSCDGCDVTIPPVFPDHHVSMINNYQGKNMLHIIFMGGYGEFMDGRGRMLLCRDCAVRLVDAFPIIQKIIDKAEF